MISYMNYGDYSDNRCDNHRDRNVELELHVVNTVSLSMLVVYAAVCNTKITQILLQSMNGKEKRNIFEFSYYCRTVFHFDCNLEFEIIQLVNHLRKILERMND